MPENGVVKRRHDEILSVDEISEIVGAAAVCGIRKVRITGGEPLVRRGIVEICRRVAAVEGINEVCLTTNGILLPEFASDLKSAGVDRINISLDSLNRVKYNEITRFDALDSALEGLHVALDAGFDAVKVNAVLIGGVNDSDVLHLLELTLKYKVDVRFIELMPIGEYSDWSPDRFVSAQSVLSIAPDLREVGSDGVAKQYMLPGGLGTVGLINPVSSHFCPTCNRIRITPDGFLKPCLHSPEEVSLRGLHGDELISTIRNAIFNKPQKHDLNVDNINKIESNTTKRNMNEIGG